MEGKLHSKLRDLKTEHQKTPASMKDDDFVTENDMTHIYKQGLTMARPLGCCS